MKLRNKKTGEIREVKNILIDGMFSVSSLAELSEEWEDAPEEPKVGYIIDPMEEDYIYVSADDSGYEEADIERAKELGIWFETKEEAEKAAEKLKAWQRLRENHFKFDEYDILNQTATWLVSREYDEYSSDIDLLFGGEE